MYLSSRLCGFSGDADAVEPIKPIELGPIGDAGCAEEVPAARRTAGDT